MLAIGNTLVSLNLLERHFVCDISACKGECCIKGDAGAPLEDHEIEILETIIDRLEPYMDDKGKAEVQARGVFEIDKDGDKGTVLLENGRCAFAIIDDAGNYKCAIEQAQVSGGVSFKKPISCHLYPVRITKYENYDAVNYDRWDICKPACECGTELKVPLFRFVKDALKRKYGSEWYGELVAIDELSRKEDG